MPVDSTHPQHDATRQKWQTMRDVLGGPAAVKAAGVLYLPELSGQSSTEYCAYKERAQFLGATAKTAQALHGFVMRKDPQVTAPDALADFLDDATKTGVTWYDYTKAILADVIGLGRAGTLIDFDGETENRPYLVSYCAEDVINWKVTRIRGEMVLSLVTLFEMDPEWIPLDDGKEAPDHYQAAAFPQWRVLEVKQDGSGEPYVTVSVYRKKESKAKDAEFVLVNQIHMMRRGQPLARIPFVFHNADGGLATVGRVPLGDMADINLSHYRTSADYENACHMIGVPTPYVFGVEMKKGETLKLGTSTCIVAANPQASAGYMEFKGEGLTALKDNLAAKERQMAALGAKMLEPENNKAEAFETVMVRGAAQAASLTSIALATSDTLTSVLQWVAWWVGTHEKPQDLGPTVIREELNTEFVAGAMPSDQLTALSTAYTGGSLPLEVYFYGLQRGEMIPPDMDLETFKAELETTAAGLPAFQQPPAPSPNPTPKPGTK